jgi:membrane protein YdbS with pleckstrin-like domain
LEKEENSVDDKKINHNSEPQDSFEIFSYADYKKQHDAIKSETLTKKIAHKIKHHKVTKSEYEQIYEELKKLDPNEPILWMGKPSQAIHLTAYAACFLFGAMIIPLLIAYYIYLQTKHTIYVITNQRLRVYSGVFFKRIDEVELYRVKDTIFLQPFSLRWFGLSNIQLITSDSTWGDSMIKGIPNGRMLRERIRNRVELIREKKGIREVDYYTQTEVPPPGL